MQIVKMRIETIGRQIRSSFFVFLYFSAFKIFSTGTPSRKQEMKVQSNGSAKSTLALSIIRFTKHKCSVSLPVTTDKKFHFGVGEDLY